MSENLHVVPSWQEHSTTEACWCNPQPEIQPGGGTVWVHNERDPRVSVILEGLLTSADGYYEAVDMTVTKDDDEPTAAP